MGSAWFNRWTKHMRLDPEIWGVTMLTILPMAWFINYSWRQTVLQPQHQNNIEPSQLNEMEHEVGQQVKEQKDKNFLSARMEKTQDPLIQRAQVIEERGAQQNIHR